MVTNIDARGHPRGHSESRLTRPRTPGQRELNPVRWAGPRGRRVCGNLHGWLVSHPKADWVLRSGTIRARPPRRPSMTARRTGHPFCPGGHAAISRHGTAQHTRRRWYPLSHTGVPAVVGGLWVPKTQANHDQAEFCERDRDRERREPVVQQPCGDPGREEEDTLGARPAGAANSSPAHAP